MKTRGCLLRFTNLLVTLLIVCFVPISGQISDNRQLRNESVSSFRYVIIENRLDEDKNTGERSRVVEILLDKKAFSEKNLRLLFQLVSKRFSDAKLLDVWVHSSLEQAPTPEERDEGGTSRNPNESTKKYYWAVYLRSLDDEYFRYSPITDKSDNKLVQLKKSKK